MYLYEGEFRLAERLLLGHLISNIVLGHIIKFKSSLDHRNMLSRFDA